jgi:hypothetical protein
MSVSPSRTSKRVASKQAGGEERTSAHYGSSVGSLIQRYELMKELRKDQGNMQQLASVHT